MNVKNLLASTQNFNPNYRCYYEKNKKCLPISQLNYDTERHQLLLIAASTADIAIKIHEIQLICKILNSDTPIYILIDQQLNPFFGFKIIERKKLYFR